MWLHASQFHKLPTKGVTHQGDFAGEPGTNTSCKLHRPRLPFPHSVDLLAQKGSLMPSRCYPVCRQLTCFVQTDSFERAHEVSTTIIGAWASHCTWRNIPQ